MRSILQGAGRLTGGPALTSLGVTKRRLRHTPTTVAELPDRQPPAGRTAPERVTGRRGGSLPAAVRFDFGWVDPDRAPTMQTLVVRPLAAADVDTLAAAFTAATGSTAGLRPLSPSLPGTTAAAAEPDRTARRFRRYLAEQAAGERLVLVAESDATLCGHLCVRWRSGYPPFRAAEIPEIVDLHVLAPHRRRGVATVLLEVAESTVATRSTTVGIGVGLHGEFGAAQRLYVKRGFVPDGRGLSYAGRPVAPGAMVRADESAALMLTKRIR